MRSANGTNRAGIRLEGSDEPVAEVYFPSTSWQLAKINDMSSIGLALRTLRDVKDAPLNADRVVVGDNSGIFQTKDAVEIGADRELSPSGRGVGGRFGETPVVVLDETLENVFGLIPSLSLSESEFGDEPILKGAPEPLDPAASLR